MNNHISVGKSTIRINRHLDTLSIYGECSILFDFSALSLDRIIMILATDLLCPIIYEQAQFFIPIVTQRLEDSNGKLILYWIDGLHSLKQHEQYWCYKNDNQLIDPTIILIKSLYLCGKDELLENNWRTLYNVEFDHVIN